MLSSDLVSTVEFAPGGYDASYGRHLGGLVSVDTVDLDPEGGVGASVSADLYDAAAQVSVPMGRRWALAVAGRHAHIGPVVRQTYPAVGEFFPLPQYHDAFLRIAHRSPSGARIDITGLHSADRTRRVAPSPDPARRAEEDRRLHFTRGWFRYRHQIDDRAETSVMLFAGADARDDLDAFGPVRTSIQTRAALGGLRAHYRYRLAPPLRAEVGIDAQITSTRVARTGSLGLPPREGDVRVFGQPPPDQLSADTFTVTDIAVAPWVDLTLNLLDDRLTVSAGLRAEPYISSVSRALPAVGPNPGFGLYTQDFRFEPRGSVRFDATQAVGVFVLGGLYGQPPPAEDRSATFGNPTLAPARSAHAVFGLALRPLDSLTTEITTYYTRADGLAMRNDSAQPSVAQVLVPVGTGENYGVQTLLRVQRWRGLFGWLSYTLSWSDRRDRPDAPWRRSDYDQRHTFGAVAGYELPKGFEVGLRARVATGFPRTDVRAAFFDVRRDLYQPLFGDHNRLRLPTFWQADARVAKRFEIQRSSIELSLDIQNITNHVNTEEYFYNDDFSERGGIRGLPTLPVLGLRWSL